MDATNVPTYHEIEVTQRKWYSAVQTRCVGRDEFGTPTIDVHVRRWHPGAWLYMWRMRRADYITMPMAEA